MSYWEHHICENCWKRHNPNREPVKLNLEHVQLSPCCFCGSNHRSGIYVREAAAGLWCRGERGIHSGQ